MSNAQWNSDQALGEAAQRKWHREQEEAVSTVGRLTEELATLRATLDHWRPIVFEARLLYAEREISPGNIIKAFAAMPARYWP
jgi:hypothetical protein